MVALLVVVAVVALTGCGVVSALLDTRQGLRDAGYQSVSVHFAFGSPGGRVTAHVTVAAPPTQADVRDVASVVWRHLHQRFDTLDVSVRGTGPGAGQVANGTFTFAELQGLFGARDPSWDRTTIKQSAEHLGFAIIGGVIVAVAAVVLGVVMTRRRRRRRAIWGGGGPPWAGEGRAPLWPPPPGPPANPWWVSGRPTSPAGGSWGPRPDDSPPAGGSWEGVVAAPAGPAGNSWEPGPGGSPEAVAIPAPPAKDSSASAIAGSAPVRDGSWASAGPVPPPTDPWGSGPLPAPPARDSAWAAPPAGPSPEVSWGSGAPPARDGSWAAPPAGPSPEVSWGSGAPPARDGAWAAPLGGPSPEVSWGSGPPAPARPSETSVSPADDGDGWGPPRLPD